IACREIGERLITRDPDITRLLDRLESRGLITRGRDEKDRRVIAIRITEAGLELLANLDEPVKQMHKKQLGHLSQTQLQQLLELLEQARNR
ncbi:MAG TPA: MarR family transcriptional regulator, partial [Tepidisphaeraceae bacterium]|nr:MarR family transcriptional regulator [Tepidisphaeraceae bacterium]